MCNKAENILSFVNFSEILTIRAVDSTHNKYINPLLSNRDINSIEEYSEYARKQGELVELKSKIDHPINAFNFPPLSFIANIFKKIIPPFKSLVELQTEISKLCLELESEIAEIYSDRHIFRLFGGKKEFEKLPEFHVKADDTLIRSKKMTSPIMRCYFIYPHEKKKLPLILIRVKNVISGKLFIQPYFPSSTNTSRTWQTTMVNKNIRLSNIVTGYNKPLSFPAIGNSNGINYSNQQETAGYALLRELIIDKKAHTYNSDGITNDKINFVVE